MESGSSCDYKALIDELTQGRDQAQKLGDHLSSFSSSQSQDFLQKIMSSYEKALLILRWSGPAGDFVHSSTPLSGGAPDTSRSVNGSPRSDEFNNGIKDHQNYTNVSKKRKTLTTWTNQVRVSPDNGFEGSADDGYSWRKYGQKDILGTKYPRSYYRCTYRHMHNCWATKQVQRSDDPSVFDITYKGTHTCNLDSNSVPPPATPELQQNQMLMSLRENLRVKTDDESIIPFSFSPTYINDTTPENKSYGLDFHQISDISTTYPRCEPHSYGPHSFSRECPQEVPADDCFLGSYTPTLISPATSESNYFSFSTNTSSASSPIMGMEYFSVDHVGLDTNFPFDTPGFFTGAC